MVLCSRYIMDHTQLITGGYALQAFYKQCGHDESLGCGKFRGRHNWRLKLNSIRKYPKVSQSYFCYKIFRQYRWFRLATNWSNVVKTFIFKVQGLYSFLNKTAVLQISVEKVNIKLFSMGLIFRNQGWKMFKKLIKSIVSCLAMPYMRWNSASHRGKHFKLIP